MDKTEFLGKLQLCYFGDRNAFDEIVELFDRMQKEIDTLKMSEEEWLDNTIGDNNEDR